MAWWNKTNKNLVGEGNPQNLNQRFSFTSHTRKGDLQGRPRNNRHSLHLASPTRGGDLHRKSVGFKTLTIACLALALISTISLNIIRTYSINNTRTNALDNTTSGIATQSASDGNTLANPLSISIKLSPVTTNTTSNPDDGSAIVSLNIPADGGVAVGGHSVEVTTNSTAGYKVTMSLDNGHDSTDLVNTDLPSQIIPSLPEPTSDTLTPLEDKTWGVALLFDSYSDWFSPEEDYLSTDQTVLSQAKFIAPGYILRMLGGIGLSKQPTGPNHDGTAADNLGNIYYGVRVDDPSTFTAGQYTTSITYTAIANIPPAPELTKLVLNDSVQQNQTSEFAIEGTNLDTVYDVWIDYNDNGIEDANEKATNVTTYPNTNKASTIISFTNPNPTSNTVSPGTYDVYVVGQGGTSRPLTNAFIVQEESICRNGDPNSDCQVDIDDNMIPIYYAGNNTDGSAIWKVANVNNLGEWYDYTKKQWANAVTVQSNKLTTYKNKPGTVINNNDVLGYWVYIPRYAYEVQRPNAVDRVVTDEYPLPDNVNTTGDKNSPYNKHSIRNEFSIHFEKATDTKKTPAETCNTLDITNPNQMWANGTPTKEAGPDNTNILAKDYRTGCAAPGNANNISRLYTDANTTANNTTWATHPAFTFGSTELNGLWIGKFETTGKVNAPTIKPNQHANTYEYVGTFYTMAKYIGVLDPRNTGGNNVSGLSANSHHLDSATTHMMKNSEWGATAYLSSSKYGAGTNNVLINAAYPSASSDQDGTLSAYGITGCGPYDDINITLRYSDGVSLGSNIIESPNACSNDSKLGLQRAYNGDIGQLASTTNNVYGVYDMSGGSSEYVAANLTNTNTASTAGASSQYFVYGVGEPYVDLYYESTGGFNVASKWSYSSSSQAYNNEACTWATCGGDAIHETKRYQAVSGSSQSWGDDTAYFPYGAFRWFHRGGTAGHSGGGAGLFFMGPESGIRWNSYAVRAVLLSFSTS